MALVTAASSGLGKAIAAALVAEGAQVAMTSRSKERIEAAAREVGGRAYVADNAELDGLSALVDAVESDLGPIQILVTNTGGPPVGDDPLAFPPDAWQRAYAELVLAPMTLIRAVVPGMRARGYGRIVNSSSSAAREPLPNIMLSNVHRAGMLAAFKTLAYDLARDGITVNTVVPGRFGTDRVVAVFGSVEAAQEVARREIPVGRLGHPEEYAAAAVFLCSEPASYITGTTLLVDGGITRAV